MSWLSGGGAWRSSVGPYDGGEPALRQCSGCVGACTVPRRVLASAAGSCSRHGLHGTVRQWRGVGTRGTVVKGLNAI